MKYIDYLKLDDSLFNKNSKNEYESIYILYYTNAQNIVVSYGNGIIFDNEHKYDIKHKYKYCTLLGLYGGPKFFFSIYLLK